ncbi:hypothetical protein FH972_000867 [Carpinus fangiana]|uniref:Uncharacterized protein n=1 Tax=Carpinus fangiana TaxID=176857 RepID=A0A5N6QBU7_9ROSI|nr:hypothetical protein FH972_000867 [Carpinus fangiana]
MWCEIVSGNRRECKEEAPEDEMMTLEDFLAQAGSVEDEDMKVESNEEDAEELLCCLSQLKRLQLVHCNDISGEGFSGVAAKLLLLEELVISYCPLLTEALEAVGRCCPLLKSLKFNI